jgi:hypothetical protein
MSARGFDRLAGSMRNSPRRVAFVNATSIFFGLLIVLSTILLLYWMRKLKPQIAGFRSQKDVPFLRIDHISTKSSLLRVWRGQHLTAVSVRMEK